MDNLSPEEIATPRTDEASSYGWSGDAMCVSDDFARELERENVLALRRIAELEQQVISLTEECKEYAQRLGDQHTWASRALRENEELRKQSSETKAVSTCFNCGANLTNHPIAAAGHQCALPPQRGTNDEPAAFIVVKRGDGARIEFATLPGYYLAPNEELISEMPLYRRSQPPSNDRKEIDELRHALRIIVAGPDVGPCDLPTADHVLGWARGIAQVALLPKFAVEPSGERDL